MATLPPTLHPASLDMGVPAGPLGECTAEAKRFAAAALIQMHDAGDAGNAGNAAEPPQEYLSPSIILDNETQDSQACYEGDTILSAAQALHDASWASLTTHETPFGLTDSMQCGACSDAAFAAAYAVSGICLCSSDGYDAPVLQQRSWDIVDTTQLDCSTPPSTELTPPDVCLAERTLDLDMEPLDAASLEDAFDELDARRRAEQASGSSVSPTSLVSTPATSADRGLLCNGCAAPLSNDGRASLSLPSSPRRRPPSPPPPLATQARRPLRSHGRPREARQHDPPAAASQCVGQKMGGKPQPKTQQRKPGRGSVQERQGACKKRRRSSNRQRTPQQRRAGEEFFLASAAAFQRNSKKLVFTPQRRSHVWVSDAGLERVELEPGSITETPCWMDVRPGGAASYAVRLSWHADREVFCGRDEIRGKRLAISREMAHDLLLAVGESHPFDYEAIELLSGSLTE
ncbi:hypothetical protein BJF96_g588 [Verticillium dahliae]|uniref:Uncharacterized protein n=1 Tax=Verticillium dahliae TaxID=27337 RepID=A0AA44WUR1_VERDA|nr:hypothetical protein BJF96_g550 [Verticillium dahliae]PNH36625.1 hypothetical protein BJF96_g588 [Verticillium dahliae]